jgi:hypothetical protein
MSFNSGVDDGAFHPSPKSARVYFTVAPYGGFSSKVFLTQSAASYPLLVGGNLILNLTLVFGLSTFPAHATLGIPSTPTIVNVGLQHLFK